eukprot:gnl/MRDRNA2_/MRDRNA2_53570_c0_seq1.p1 gnl/MRDRNA2_/MRDRNA2_53570_c0~~gnl/MRDRNA2_/MRDRNA2_53570_c0_seq1.p1  ORF type:complete len:570 (-),score=81.83 gnl/MRDRNA2_/MRDRNA2_53570_c0_seq1:206-1846(-)
MGAQKIRSRSAAVQWRTTERPRTLAERAHQHTIFEGLEDIDNMIDGEHIQPNSPRSSSPSPKQTLHSVSKPGVKRQLVVSQRMHNGQCSAGEQTEDITEQVHQLVTLPQVVAPGGGPSPQMTSRARKYRRVCDSSGSQHSPCPTTSLPEVDRPATSGPHHSPRTLSPLPDIRRPASCRPSRSSSSRSSRSRFQDHQDLFATVLTPRSRSTLGKVKRPQILPLDDTDSNASSIGSFGMRTLHTPPPLLSTTAEASTSLCSKSTVSPSSQMGPLEKQNAFKALRLLIFGQNKSGTDRDKLRIFNQQIGSAKQSKEFFKFWVQADPQLHGSAEHTEFQAALHYLESSAQVHKIHSMKITSLLINRHSGLVTMEAVAEAIWPEITSSQIAEIWQHCEIEQEKVARRVGVAEPPVLAEEDRIALESVFSDLDKENTGYVSFEALVAARDSCMLPIIDDVDMIKRYMAEQDASGSGCITLEQFLLMMCPAGFRALKSSNIATLESGAAISRSNTGTWYMSDDDEHGRGQILEAFRRSVKKCSNAKMLSKMLS